MGGGIVTALGSSNQAGRGRTVEAPRGAGDSCLLQCVCVGGWVWVYLAALLSAQDGSWRATLGSMVCEQKSQSEIASRGSYLHRSVKPTSWLESAGMAGSGF